MRDIGTAKHNARPPHATVHPRSLHPSGYQQNGPARHAKNFPLQSGARRATDMDADAGEDAVGGGADEESRRCARPEEGSTGGRERQSAAKEDVG